MTGRYRKLGVFVILMCMLLIGMHSVKADPAPYLKQLDIGCYTYSGSQIWSASSYPTNAQLRKWYAEHYSFLIGSDRTSLSDFQDIKAYNPTMIGLVYQLYVLDSSEYNQVVQWCNSKGYDVRDLLLFTGPDANDTATIRYDPYHPGFQRWVTTPPNSPLYGPGFTTSQTRLQWDFREPKVGEYLAEKWKAAVESMGYDGAFVDEEFIIGYTNNAVAGNYCIQPPFRDITTEFWAKGSPYTSLYHNWGSNFDLQGADADNDTYHSYVDIRDSLRRARRGWMKTAGDMMKSWGYYYAPNFAAIPTSQYPNWENEGREAGVLAGSYIMGEYSYFYPGADDYEINCNNAVRACYSAKDDPTNLFVGWIRMGQYDLAQGKSYERSKMSGLGLMLDCYFPGQAKYLFSPCIKNGQVDFYVDRYAISGYTAPDTTTMWSYAWGKYFGIPQITRDTTQKGIDPAGQSYTMHKVQLMNPNNGSVVQTLAVGRYARGANFSLTSTRVTVNLGDSYYELLESGKYSGPTTTTSIGNAEWRVFVKDTTLANTGVAGGDPGDNTAPQIQLDSVKMGSVDGTVDMYWKAPGDDGTVGQATRYDIRYSTSPITLSNFYIASKASNIPTPAVAGTSEKFTIQAVPGEKYYTAILAFDDAYNQSNLASSGAVFAKGIKKPIPIFTETNTDNNTVTAACEPVDSYFPLSYDFQVDVSGGFVNPSLMSSLDDTTAVYSGLADGIVYYWRVRAVSNTSSDVSQWSEYIKFSLNNRIVVFITGDDFIAPVSGDIFTTPTPTMVVKNVPQTENIYFEVDDSNNYPSPISSGIITLDSSGSYSWTIPTDLQNSVPYFVRASVDSLNWSESINFTVSSLSTGSAAGLMPYVYPSPFKISYGNYATFTNVPDRATLKIYSSDGDMVWRKDNTTGEDILWDGSNLSNGKVSIGIYIWYFEKEDGTNDVGKIAIVK